MSYSKNKESLCDLMDDVINDLRSKNENSISVRNATVISRAAANILKAQQLEMQYKAMRGEKPEMEFFDKQKTKTKRAA